VNNGYQAVPMRKTGLPAHVVLGEAALSVIDTYLKERNDDSPFVFIQHGRISAPPREHSPSEQAYRSRTKGYGAQISRGLVRKIVLQMARKVGYNLQKEFFTSAHAFRHWHAQRLIRLGASIDQVQSVLGHARTQTTKEIYAPEPNVPQILQWEEAIRSLEYLIVLLSIKSPPSPLPENTTNLQSNATPETGARAAREESIAG